MKLRFNPDIFLSSGHYQAVQSVVPQSRYSHTLRVHEMTFYDCIKYFCLCASIERANGLGLIARLLSSLSKFLRLGI